MGILRATKYKTFLKLSAAVFVLATIFVAGLIPNSRASAATPTASTTIKTASATSVTDSSGNVYSPKGYSCVVKSTDGTVPTLNPVNPQSSYKDCSSVGSMQPSYIWKTSKSPVYVLAVTASTHLPSVPSGAGTKYDPKNCVLTKTDGFCSISFWSESTNGLTLTAAPSSPSTSVDTTSSVDASEIACTKSITNPLTWIVCPLVSAASDSVNVFDGQITCLMQIDLTDIFGTGTNANNPNATACGTSTNSIAGSTSASSDAYYKAWNTFRSFALALMVIAGLVMVISQAVGFELLDAYTIRKVLPRLLIAGVAITLSWQIMQFLVQITNAIGFGIRDIIYSPFSDFSGATISGFGSTFAGALLTGGAFLSLGLAGLGLFALTALLAVLVAFITLVLRKMVIIFLLMMAPFAIASFILPNTQKIWKLWWDTLSKALLMFPIIAGMIAVGHVFAATSYGTGGGGATSQIIAFIAYFLPYFMIPTAVRMAGGAVGSIGGMVSKASQGGFTALKKGRAGIREKNMHAIRSGTRWQGNPVGEKLSKGLQNVSLLSKSGLDPRHMRGRMDAARSTITSARSAEGEKSAAVQSILGNDAVMLAGVDGNGTDADASAYLQSAAGGFQTGRVLEQNVAAIRQAKREMGTEAFQDFIASSLPGTGTAFVKGGAAEMLEMINHVAGNDRARAGRILNKARGAADRARRVDLSGAGFGKSIEQMEALHSGTTNFAAVNEAMTDSALESKSAGEIASARNNGFVNMAPAILRRQARADAAVARAEASGDSNAIAVAKHEQKRILAHTSALLDVAGQVSPENANVVGSIMGQKTGKIVEDQTRDEYETRQKIDIDGNPAIDSTTNLPVMERVKIKSGIKEETWGDRIERTEGDAVFKQYKKTYSSDRQSAQAAAAAAAAAGGIPGSIPGGTGPAAP